MKICSKCTIEKPLTEFHLKRGKPQAQCIECRAEYMAKHYQDNRDVEVKKRKTWYKENKSIISEKGKAERKANPEKTKRVNFKRNLKKYGITELQYFQKLEEQNNVCSICQTTFTGTPHIDHCHDTNEFRGILHRECNTAFGLLKEDIARFQGCIAYKLKYKK